MAVLVRLARDGDVAAVKELFDRSLGRSGNFDAWLQRELAAPAAAGMAAERAEVDLIVHDAEARTLYRRLEARLEVLRAERDGEIPMAQGGDDGDGRAEPGGEPGR